MALIPIYWWNKEVHNFRISQDSFKKQPWANGVILLACVAVAMLLANLPFTKHFYHNFLQTELTVHVASPDGSVDWFFLGGFLDSQSLIVVIIKGVEGIGIIRYDLKQGIRLIVRQHRLVLNGTSQHTHQLAQLSYLLLADALVDDVAFNEIFLQHSIGPLTESYATLGIDTISNRNNHI